MSSLTSLFIALVSSFQFYHLKERESFWSLHCHYTFTVSWLLFSCPIVNGQRAFINPLYNRHWINDVFTKIISSYVVQHDENTELTGFGNRVQSCPHAVTATRLSVRDKNPNRTIIRDGLFVETIGKKHGQLMSITVSLHPRLRLAKLHNINNV